MSILGHGIDIVPIKEFEVFLKADEQGISSRCFSVEEIKCLYEGQNRIDTLAGKFAAKEAVLKALRTGFGAGIAMNDIEILRKEGFPPEVYLTGAVKDLAQTLGIQSWHLSISQAGGFATASVIASS
jgi:holo-[acyl-carrier protein] synthase